MGAFLGSGPVLAVGALAMLILGGVALVIGMARGTESEIGGLERLLGGWRALDWPHGVQEDDPESAWALHPIGTAGHPGPADATGPGDRDWPDSPPDADQPTSWIEFLD